MAAARKSKPDPTRTTAKTQTGAFNDPSGPPADVDLAAALGRADSLWRALIREARVSCGPLGEEWSFSKALGWTLRLKQPARVLVYLTPGTSRFLASFVLGDRACAEIRGAGIPSAILALIDAAPKYSEGRGVRIPVRSKADLEAVVKIARIKVTSTR